MGMQPPAAGCFYKAWPVAKPKGAPAELPPTLHLVYLLPYAILRLLSALGGLRELSLPVSRDRLVAVVLHGELSLALRHAAQAGAVAKHVAQRHLHSLARQDPHVAQLFRLRAGASGKSP